MTNVKSANKQTVGVKETVKYVRIPYGLKVYYNKD
jgi:hypothetical protein